MGANASGPDPTHRRSTSHASQMSASADSDSGLSSRLAGGADRKKKSSKLSTLKKKLSRVRRPGRCHDYGKAFRELTAGWSVRELHSLADDYEGSATLKELTTLADLARPHASRAVEDLAALHERGYCADVELVYQGSVFPAHRAILCVRCAFFRELLARHPDHGARVAVTVRTPGVDVAMFRALLRFLYTGSLGSGGGGAMGADESKVQRKLLQQIVLEFGAPNSLEQDLRTLLDTGAYSDAILVFADQDSAGGYDAGGYGGASRSAQCPHASSCPHGAPKCPHSAPPCPRAAAACPYATLHAAGPAAKNDGTVSMMRRYRSELRCHRAILAARSPFFRSLEQRRGGRDEPPPWGGGRAPSYIVLDESIIPKRYARVLLGAIYLDSVDLSCIMRSSISVPTLSGTGASEGGTVSGAVSGGVSAAGSGGVSSSMTQIDEAMELYQIGRFLEVAALSHGCEDLIAESLSVEQLPLVLAWSAEPHGSAWVHRQALHFLREEFVQVCAASTVLAELSKEQMVEAIGSDFLQARETDVLAAVIKWAEFKLMKRIEEREPNLLSHTAHSISRKGVRRKDLSDSELRDICADLLPLVRTVHVLPAHGDTLACAVKRGLVSTPPTHLLGGGGGGGGGEGGSSACCWVRTRNLGMYVKPRLFAPYYDELKALMKEQNVKAQDSAACSSSASLHVVHMCTKPDALYMLEDRMYAVAPPGGAPQHWLTAPGGGHGGGGRASSTVDIIAGTIPDCLGAAPDRAVLAAMRQRETELQRSKSAQRAYALHGPDGAVTVTHLLRLRVVREFGLPPSAIQLLQEAPSPPPAPPAPPPQMCLHHGQHRDEAALGGAVGGYVTPPPPGGVGRMGSARGAVGGVAGGAAGRCMDRRHASVRQVWAQPRGEVGHATLPRGASVSQRADHKLAGSCSSTLLLRRGMPDIAMATDSASRLSMQDSDPDLPPQPDFDLGRADLDLGDGASHCGGGGGAGGSDGNGSMYI